MKSVKDKVFIKAMSYITYINRENVIGAFVVRLGYISDSADFAKDYLLWNDMEIK